MKKMSLLLFGFGALALTGPSPASALTDGGPQNYCNDGGRAWISCATHTDCPDNQICGDTRHCICGEAPSACGYGEQTCFDGGCRCASMPRPREGCRLVTNEATGRWEHDCSPEEDDGCAVGGSPANASPLLAVVALLWRRRSAQGG